MKYLIGLFLFMMTFQLQATTYIPLGLDKQLDEADAVIEGTFQGQHYQRLGSGEVVTVASFKMDQSAGLAESETYQMNSFPVMFPGGKWQDIRHHIPGGPKFQMGEKVVLLLKKTQHGYFLSNFGLGKYQLSTEDNLTYLQSAVFPHHPKLGRISYKKFSNKVANKWGQPLERMELNKYVAVPKKKKETSRSPASLDEPRAEVHEKQDPIGWFIFALGMLGVLSIYLSRRQHD